MTSLSAMPVVVVNLGGEMMYVLRQRLIAQKIDKAKARQVLNEVVGAMFNANFIEELFKPHTLYTFEATKHIFQRLAHCSIMKLNETSMSKLYDLMTMVFKFQVLNCRSPSEIVQVTFRHIDALREYVDAPVQEQLDSCRARVEQTYLSFSISQLWSLKETLLDFLQGRHTKVSLLLEKEFQRRDGKIVIALDGPCPAETPVPGTVRHFDADNTVSLEYKLPLAVFNESGPIEYDADEFVRAHELLGSNLYQLFRGVTTSEDTPESKDADDADAAAEEKVMGGSEELNILADLIVPSAAAAAGRSSAGGSTETIRLNLFDASANDSMQFKTSGLGKSAADHHPCGADKKDAAPSFATVDAKASRKSMQQRMAELDLDDELGRGVENGASKEADDSDSENDLLDLMDAATEMQGRGNHK